MESLINTVREAITEGASEQARAAGAQACRALLAAFEAKIGEPLTTQPASASVSPPIQALASALRGMTADQLLDTLIVRLKDAVPAGTDVANVRSLKIPLVSIGGKS